jgi:alpha-mannosidase
MGRRALPGIAPGNPDHPGMIKKMNRKLEFLFRKVEKLYAIYAPEAYPQQVLDACWEDLLLNQFHDIIPGTSIQRVNQEYLEQYYDIESKLLSLESEGRKLQHQHRGFPERSKPAGGRERFELE